MEDIPDQAWVCENPAQQEGWACECGERLDLPVQGDTTTVMAASIATFMAFVVGSLPFVLHPRFSES